MEKRIIKNKPELQLDSQKAGIDIGSKSVFVCISNNLKEQEVKEFPFFTKDIISLGNWLSSKGVKSIAVESTGIYWQPLFEILAPFEFELVLCNASHLKNVPGRKTDIKDAQWIQQLHSAGLLRGSFRPSDTIIPLRTYVRKKKDLSSQVARQINLMYKALREMNIQLDLVLSSTAGKTGLAIIKAIVAGERNPQKLTSLKEKNTKVSSEEFEKALQGTWREEHIFELTVAYELYEYINRQIVLCEEKIKQALAAVKENIPENKPNEPMNQLKQVVAEPKKKVKKNEYNRWALSFNAIELLEKKARTDLTAVPGINENTALVIMAECGVDMSKFPSKKHFSSWLGLAPNHKISGGKILDNRTKPSSNRAAQALRMSAQALSRTDTWLGAYFRRMRGKLGAPKAITATAHKIACLIYRMLKYGISYIELGAEYYEEKYKERLVSGLKKKAASLGFELNPLLVLT